jgi:hypothetical protein
MPELALAGDPVSISEAKSLHKQNKLGVRHSFIYGVLMSHRDARICGEFGCLIRCAGRDARDDAR